MTEQVQITVSVISEDGRVRSLGTTKSIKDFMRMVCLSNRALQQTKNPDVITIVERG